MNNIRVNIIRLQYLVFAKQALLFRPICIPKNGIKDHKLYIYSSKTSLDLCIANIYRKKKVKNAALGKVF
jgi:hypothetical protein